MKTKILCLMALSLSISAIRAQDSTATITPKQDIPRVEFGFRLMPTLSAFDLETPGGGTIKGEGTLGFGIGGLIAVNVTNNYGIQAELIYNSLSQKYKDAALSRTIKVKYVNVPILFSMNTGKANLINLNAVLGPQFGFNIGSSFSTGGGQNSDTISYIITTKKSDFGFAYGAGLEFKLNEEENIRLDMGFRGVYGFVNVSNVEVSENNSTVILNRAKVRTYSGYLGISFLF